MQGVELCRYSGLFQGVCNAADAYPSTGSGTR